MNWTIPRSSGSFIRSALFLLVAGVLSAKAQRVIASELVWPRYWLIDAKSRIIVCVA
jgi:hypothetical protein